MIASEGWDTFEFKVLVIFLGISEKEDVLRQNMAHSFLLSNDFLFSIISLCKTNIASF